MIKKFEDKAIKKKPIILIDARNDESYEVDEYEDWEDDEPEDEAKEILDKEFEVEEE